MTEPMQFLCMPFGGIIRDTDKRQEVMPRNPDRIGGYLANTSEHVLSVFMGEAVKLEPWRGIAIPETYQGPVTITGRYMDRFTAAAFVKAPAPC
jgi:hypothetical protein